MKADRDQSGAGPVRSTYPTLPALAGLALLLAAGLISGCASTAGQWTIPPVETAEPDQPWAEALARIHADHVRANDAESLARIIARLEALLDSHPGAAAVRVELAEALVLYGAAYATGRSVKRHLFSDAQAHAESALLTNPGFRSAIEAGQRPGLAASKLESADLPAMVIWATATAYLFDEGMTGLGRLRNFRGLEDLRLFMEQAMTLAPEHEYGLVPFSLAVFHIAAPPIAGGDLDRAAALIEQAIATPGVSLLPKWGRARYLHALTGDREARRADLEWVLAQDPSTADSPYRWNVFVQRDARRMLESL
ncbi:MAG: hypothetical protein EA370_04880 [Wenzhouxiangella sp.]|nr:MAG: hypothetical protein EA370_04880 [Wenzhouxiangella sp.]